MKLTFGLKVDVIDQRGWYIARFVQQGLSLTSQAYTGADRILAPMPNNCNSFTLTESLATQYNWSKMPEPNNYVRHQSVDDTLILQSPTAYSVCHNGKFGD